MTFDEYQQRAGEFAVYPKNREREYLALGLISEVGELAGKVKKEIRDDCDLSKEIIDEAGDVMWYVAMLCSSYHRNMSSVFEVHQMWTMKFDVTENHVRRIAKETACAAERYEFNIDALEELTFELVGLCANYATRIEAVCEANIAKLQSRQERGKLGGSGDNR